MAMIRFRGGSVQVVTTGEDGERLKTAKEIDEFRQTYCQTEYFWPRAGAVISVPDELGGWLIAKNPTLLEQVAGKPHPSAPAHPRQIVGIVPSRDEGSALPSQPTPKK